MIIGPQAVGKMAVGKALSSDLDYKFSHNHHSIELALNFYEYGTPPFDKINRGIRRLIFDTILEYEHSGFIFTYMMSFNDDNEIDHLRSLLNHFDKPDWEMYFVELSATLETRLRRNHHPERLEAKVSKRDIKASESRILKSMETHVLNSSEKYPFPLNRLGIKTSNYIKIKNDDISIDEQVKQIISSFDL